VISATSGACTNIGFDKEFVKKHLFVDPSPTGDAVAKATKIVGSLNLYGNLAGPARWPCRS